MPLSSSSTDAEVWAAYDDNASYDTDNSLSKCSAFITACRILLRRTPQQAIHGNRSVSSDLARIANELQQAQQWQTAAQLSAAGPRFMGPTEDFRG